MPATLRTSRRLLAAGALATVVLTSGLAPATAASATPDRVAPLQEFTNYWQPRTYDPSSAASKAATVWRGTVTDQGASVLKQNDQTLDAINHAAAAHPAQAHRALVDADYEWTETIPDALGPQLGQWFSDGVASGKLPKTAATFDEIEKTSSTSPAKAYFNYPRPFLKDRSVGGQNNLNGLADYSGITRIPDWTDSFGKTHSAEYDQMEAGYSQAFPSGHTTFVYQEGIQLAMLVPELGPEALTRSSEAGNNRIALGVHYPMDVMGGRILGHINATAQFSDTDYVSKTFAPARTELVSYLDEQCKVHGFSSDLATCVDQTGANDAKGYRNSFVDAVSAAPVTDRASALAAYRARMTYSFQRVGQSGQAARVPAGAEKLLTTAFPTLTDEQRREVLAATEIDSGYIFDSSSDGWQRIDLPAAMSAKVTLDASGKVVKVEAGQKTASVVTTGASGSGTPSPSAPATDQPTAPATTSPATAAPSAQPTSSPSASASATTSAAPSASATASASASARPTSSAAPAVAAGHGSNGGSTGSGGSVAGANGSAANGTGTGGSGSGTVAQPASGNDGAVAPATDASASESGLAQTGADAVGYVGGGIAFLALGSAAVVWGLRRREASRS